MSDHLNPDDFLDLDMTASLGSRGVAGSFVGLDDYQKGIIKFELPPEYLVELKKYIHGYPKIPGGWELTLPHHEIERFNEMIVLVARFLSVPWRPQAPAVQSRRQRSKPPEQ